MLQLVSVTRSARLSAVNVDISLKEEICLAGAEELENFEISGVWQYRDGSNRVLQFLRVEIYEDMMKHL